jgi:hypothetical protein
MNVIVQILLRVVVQIFLQYELSKFKGVKKMANQLAPGSKKSGEFIAFAGASGLAVVSEGLEYLGLPHLDPVMALSLIGGALVYGLIITLQKKFLGTSSGQLAQTGANYVQEAIQDLSGKAEVKVEATVTPAQPAVEATKPVEEVLFSDSQQDPPIPVNFAPVEKVVN